MAGKQQERGCCGDFKDSNGRACIDPLAFLHRGGQLLIRDELAFARSADPKPLVEPHQMRRGISVHTLACGFQDRAQKRYR